MLIDECALNSLNWSTTEYIPSSYQMLSMFPHDRRRENQDSVYHSKLLEIASCEFKGIAEPSCKEVNHGKSLFGSGITVTCFETKHERPSRVADSPRLRV